MKNLYSLPCNLAQTLNLVGDRWSLLILHRMFQGLGTYKELQDNLEGIPSNLLSERLKSLESDGLVESSLYQEHPPRYRYGLTASGRDLEDVFNSLVLWGQKHLAACQRQLVHGVCGHPVELRYYCPECGCMISHEELALREPGGSGADETAPDNTPPDGKND